MSRSYGRWTAILLVLLAVGATACSDMLPPVSTLMPTAVPPSAQTSLARANLAPPPTWTLTVPPLFTFTPVVPSPTPTSYLRTATPTVPSRTPTNTPTPSNTPTPTASPTPWPTIAPEEVWTLDRYPRPFRDNGWGMHWFPTYEQDMQTINRFVLELQRMHIRWVVLLNDGTDIGRNDFLVQRLVAAQMMPVMRLYVHGVVPYDGNLAEAVHHYRSLGVHYFQLYNEPNLFAEAAGREPNPDWYVSHWAPAAEIVVANGGLPGFGALSPGGEYNDLDYLRGALQSLERRNQEYLLNQGWLSIHNYAQYQPVDSTEGFMRFHLYNQIVVEELGRSIPILGTEGGHYADISEQFLHVIAEYRYLAQREDYFFCHTYWLIGNQIGGSWDDTFEYQALFRADGYTNPLVTGLFYRGP
jgi:hypothetical protein